MLPPVLKPTPMRRLPLKVIPRFAASYPETNLYSASYHESDPYAASVSEVNPRIGLFVLVT